MRADAYGNVETALGDCLSAQKRYAEAAPLLLASHDKLKRSLGEQNQTAVEAVDRLHEFYTDWNKPAEAAHFTNNAAPVPTP